MKNDRIIIAFEAGKQGVKIELNKKTSLKTGNVKNTEFWVSWDKIGKLLFDNYTDEVEVAERDKLRADA
tara:strand:+ start:242 stop:448 length:207 start_codon:yes stop_codon:yes gene_type:complete